MNKILDRETFTSQVEEATRQAGFSIEKREDDHLYIKLQGYSQRLRVSSLYQTYQATPNRLDTIIDAHINALGRLPEIASDLTEQQVVDSLLPLLQQKRWLKKTEEREVGPLTHQRLVTGIVVTYVFDFPEYRTYMNHTMLEDMQEKSGYTTEDIYGCALENLRRRIKTYEFERHGRGRYTMITCEATDGYAATSVLVPELLEEWADRIPGEMLIGIPNRDFLIAFSDQHPVGPQKLTRQVRSDARHREYPLFSDLLVWRNGKVREYRPLH